MPDLPPAPLTTLHAYIYVCYLAYNVHNAHNAATMQHLAVAQALLFLLSAANHKHTRYTFLYRQISARAFVSDTLVMLILAKHCQCNCNCICIHLIGINRNYITNHKTTDQLYLSVLSCF